MTTILQRALVIIVCLVGSRALAATTAPAGPTSPASPIAAGDVIFTEFFDGWHKLDPNTGVVTELPWPQTFASYIEFDVDGAILFGSDGSPSRLNPLTGGVTPLSVPGLSGTDGFVVEPSGDLVFANSTAVSRYSRATGMTATISSGAFFSPNGIARGADGRLFLTEFFADLWQISPETGIRSGVTPTELTIPDLIEVRSDGDLIVENFSPELLYRIDPDTGATSVFTSDLPAIVRGMALDAANDLWVSSGEGIFRYPSAGGAKTLVFDDSLFSPFGIAVVPLSWTPPPVPEPSSAVLAAITLVALRHCGIRYRMQIGAAH
jgi:streptogramin lyase